MELAELREALGPGQPEFRASQVYHALYRGKIARPGADLDAARAAAQGPRRSHTVGLPDSRASTNRATARAATCCASTTAHGRNGADARRRARHHLHLEPGGLPGGLQVLHDGADGPGAQPDRRRNRRPGAARGARERSCWRDARTAEHRHDGAGRAAAEPAERGQGDAHSAAIPQGVGLSPRRITVSTAGIIPKIEELGREPVRPKLAISLNASTEEQRQELMPITRKYHLKDLMAACKAYPLRPWEKLTFEYVLLQGVNDTDADARRVVKLLANLNCKVNLIALNPGPGIPFETPDPERVLSFQAIVRRAVPCFMRKPRGLDIYAACGQLKRNS